MERASRGRPGIPTYVPGAHYDWDIQVAEASTRQVLWENLGYSDEVLPSLNGDLVFYEDRKLPAGTRADTIFWGDIRGPGAIELGSRTHEGQRAPHSAGKKVAYEERQALTGPWELRYNELQDLGSAGILVDVRGPLNCAHVWQPKLGGGEEGTLVLFSGFACADGLHPLFVYDLERPGDPPKFIDDLGLPVPPGDLEAWLHEGRPHYDISGDRVVYARWDPGAGMFEILTYEYVP